MAGIGNDGVLNADLVHSVRPDMDHPIPLWLSVGGLTPGDHVRWIDGRLRKEVKVGDVVQFGILEIDEVDPASQ